MISKHGEFWQILAQVAIFSSQSSARNHLIGRIQSLDREGAVVRVTLDCGFPLKALVTKQSCQEMALQQGDEIIAVIKAGAIHVVPRGGAVS